MTTEHTGIALCQECRGWTDDPQALAHGWTVDSAGTVRCRTCSTSADGDEAPARRVAQAHFIRDQLRSAQADVACARGQVDWLAARLAAIQVAWHELHSAGKREVRYFAPALCIALDALDANDETEQQGAR